MTKLSNISRRNWCFTLNNPTRDELLSLVHILCKAGACDPQQSRDSVGTFCEGLSNRIPVKYLVCQQERGENGTVHIQGYFELRRTQRIRALKSYRSFSRAHLEARRGTQMEAVAYCQKLESRSPDGFALELGQKAVQGQRTDLEDIRILIARGMPEIEIAEANFATWARNYRALSRYRLLKARQGHLRDGVRSRLRQAPVIEIHWGVSGSGKSHSVYERFPAAYWTARADGVLYMDGVDEETKVIVFDDFYSWVRYDFILRLCDKYPLLLKVHGGYVQCPNLTHVIFTSNQNPREWYTSYHKMGGWEGSAFKRRIDDCGLIEHYPLRWDHLLNNA